jgi:sugar lactone lactonase YvrE
MSTLGSSTRLLAATVITVGLVSAPTAGADARTHRSDRGHPLPSRIGLPDGFQPEGITVRRGRTAYLGSLADGDIYAANLRTGKGRVISEGDGTPAVGLKLDRRGRLWVAGGNGGDAKVVSTRTGKEVAHYTFTTETSFVNDVVLRGKSAWFTDSQRPVLYQVTTRHGRATGAEVRRLPLSGDWRQLPGTFNANGISTTPDGRALLVVQSPTGYLFRVNPHTGHATRVDLGSMTLVNGDGLLRKCRTLYTAQNTDNQVAVVHLGRHRRTGHLVRTLTSAYGPRRTVKDKVVAVLRRRACRSRRRSSPRPRCASPSSTG